MKYLLKIGVFYGKKLSRISFFFLKPVQDTDGVERTAGYTHFRYSIRISNLRDFKKSIRNMRFFW